MEEAKKILLIGSGGHCASVLDSLLSSYNYESIGIIGRQSDIHSDGEEVNAVLGIPVIGEDKDLEELFSQGYTDAFVTVGSIGDSSIRNRLFHLIKKIGFHIPNIIDSSSIISNYSIFGEGIFVGKSAMINARVRVDSGTIINTSSVIEHDCIIGEMAHVATGSILCGNVKIGAGTHIGAGAMIKQGISIGSNSLIGMGSVVLKDIGDNVIAYGNPCNSR